MRSAPLGQQHLLQARGCAGALCHGCPSARCTYPSPYLQQPQPSSLLLLLEQELHGRQHVALRVHTSAAVPLQQGVETYLLGCAPTPCRRLRSPNSPNP